MRSITYRDAINEALSQEMERDPSVFIYGIDVGDHKNIFGTTKGLVDKFGDKRCFNTPLSEDAMTGFGIGAAINGLRPIHVHMRVDFMLIAVNQLFNMASSMCYGSGGKLSVPLVIRAIIGRGWGQSYQHSKTLHSIFAHIPGLKVIMPVTPYDAKGMMISAIRDNNPVIIFEHRWLYDAVGEVPEEIYESPLDKSKLVKSGNDITLVATSWMNVEALHAARILSKHNIEVEIISVPCISHLDDEPIIQSVKKTGCCIIADNDWSHCGFSAEIAARIAEKCPSYLIHPINRIGFQPVPCPCTRPLENVFYPNAINIIREVERQLDIESIDLSGEEFYSYENKFRGPF